MAQTSPPPPALQFCDLGHEFGTVPIQTQGTSTSVFAHKGAAKVKEAAVRSGGDVS